MSKVHTIKVPDLGVDGEVDVIEILVAEGDRIEVEQPILTLESEKASMEVPAGEAGVVKNWLVKVGDKVKSFDELLRVEVSEGVASGEKDASTTTPEVQPGIPNGSTPQSSGAGRDEKEGVDGSVAVAAAEVGGNYDFDVLVLGGGPGGYSGAFRAADLGLKVCLVERYPVLGGVCLNVGCIPSKALLHAANVIDEAREATSMGIVYHDPKVDLAKLRRWKADKTKKLNTGLAGLARQRKVRVVTGRGEFISDHRLKATSGGEESVISFASAIIATGSSPIVPAALRVDHPALVDSTGALELKSVPKRMLIVGGGIIGLEMATVYRALGSEIVVVEMSDQLIPDADADLVKVLTARLRKAGVDIRLSTTLQELKPKGDRLQASFGEGAAAEAFDLVLVATGRAPNSNDWGASLAGVRVDKQGFVPSDSQMRTNVGHIYSVGDVRSNPMLAHKAVHEAKVAAEVIAGDSDRIFDARGIPSVAYTDPELAWVGLTEKQAKSEGVQYEKAVFPFIASGRALSMDRPEGFTKLLFSKDSRKTLLGAAIAAPGAGDMIAECALALEMGANAEDIALTIHPHPTLSETVGFGAEIVDGSITDLLVPRR